MKLMKFIIFLNAVLILTACFDKTIDRFQLSDLKKEDFQTDLNGKKTDLFFLNNGDIKVAITNFGGRIVGLESPDRDGNLTDIVTGFSTIHDYINAEEEFHGALIGRYGNRIAEGEFTLDGQIYNLPINNYPNHLHGGPDGFHNVVWDVKNVTDTTITLFYFSKDGEMGYPGNLSVTVEYTITKNNDIIIDYHATTDKKTVINLTSHPFFNLGGEGSGTINKHILTINADHYTPVDETLIPLGIIAPVSGTPFDFRNGKPIGRDLDESIDQLAHARGYDHNFILNRTDGSGEMYFAASVLEPESGRKMIVYTQEPGLQFYGGNFSDGSTILKSGHAHRFRESFALETQHFPDSPNQPDFPSTVLYPGQDYKTRTIYRFTTGN